ncbi:MAG TPA: NAD(P)/FAD-dependent oxidoreductase [Mycobacterium sp.]|nr:NAD(P)/FAD-dependent oxidoreductase [Mycobacterium sp.]
MSANVDYDVVIIGAGISGIGAAYRIKERNPGYRYVILERRENVGGTWDLFRYPGIRSDSSIFSLSFPYEPWNRDEGIADGAHIREYLADTARKHGIYDNIRFGSHVRSADWDSATDTWTVRCDDGASYTARFVFFATGYYNYDQGYTPDFPGLEQFTGHVIHPQHWPEDLDYTGKTMVVIGSGATAVTLVPAAAERAGKVVMLQRTPSYISSYPKIDVVSKGLRKVLPRRVSHAAARFFFSLQEAMGWFLARKTPTFMKWMFRQMQTRRLPDGYDIDTHFTPPYQPWDQRICLAADGDIYDAIKAGRVEMVTDHIDHFDATGIALTSGRHLDADIVVTATGLQLQALGGVALSLDGAEIKPQDRFVYKAHMLEDVPNLFWCLGYTNASWTLRADMTARATAKLMAYMRTHGYTSAYPHHDGAPMAEKLAWDLQAGYVLRNLHALPKSGTKRPWNVRQNYFADAIDYRFDRITEAMVFGSRSA